MRILLINYEYPPIGGGAGNATFHIARELVSLGCEVKVFTSRFHSIPSVENQDGVSVRRIPVLRLRRDRCSIPEMLTFIASGILHIPGEIKSFKPAAIIVFFTIPSGPVALLANALYKVPFITSLRGGDVPGFMGRSLAVFHKITLPLTRLIWKRSVAVVANSKGLCALAKNTMNNERLLVIPNGADVNRFTPRRNYGSSDTFTILFVGRLTSQKGADTLIQAIKSLVRLSPSTKFSLKIVGDGAMRKSLVKLSQDMGVSDKVSFTGWCDRSALPALYAGADAFVLPSRDEGMPNALMEAMSCGLPVIATRVPGNTDLIEDGRNGILVEQDDSDAICHHLALFARDAALRQKLGIAARETMMLYSWNNVARQYLAIIQNSRDMD